MAIALNNDAWGYASSCFVCERSNDHGLQIPFQLDDDGETVSARFSLGAAYSGAPTIVHGGLSLAVLDEAQAWVVIAVAKKWGMTQSTQADFDGLVFVDHDYMVRAVVTKDDGGPVTTAAEIIAVGAEGEPSGSVLVRSTAAFTILGDVDPEQARLGLDDRHRRLLRED